MDNQLQAPAIGAKWPGAIDGIYAGVSRGENGEPDGHLVLLSAKPEEDLTWKDAKAWAEGLGNGARLPTRFESALLYANLRDQFDLNEWYWTGTVYESSPSYAWLQLFDYGLQLGNRQSLEFRARAVSRFPINS